MDIGLVLIGIVVFLVVAVVIYSLFVHVPFDLSSRIPVTPALPPPPNLLMNRATALTNSSMMPMPNASIIQSNISTFIPLTRPEENNNMENSMNNTMVPMISNEERINSTDPTSVSNLFMIPTTNGILREDELQSITEDQYAMRGSHPGVRSLDNELIMTRPVRQTIRLCKRGGFLRRYSKSKWHHVDKLDLESMVLEYDKSGMFKVGKSYIKSVILPSNGRDYMITIESILPVNEHVRRNK